VASERTPIDAERLAISAALGAAALVATIDALSPDTNYTSMFLFLPMIGSTATSPKRTLWLGALAIVLGATFLWIDQATVGPAVVRLIGLIAGSVLAALIAATRIRREQRLDDLDRFANIAQSLIIRPVPARLANTGAAGRYLSASDVVAVGGDLYDVALTPVGVRFLIGDACGKGLGGVRLAAEVLTAFREAVFVEGDLADLVRTLERHVVAVCRREGHDLDFVTAVVGDLTDDGELLVASCGHPDGLLLTADGPVPLTPETRTCPLGLGATPTITRFELAVGDRAVWWTDGASEARDTGGRFFPIEETIAASGRRIELGAALDVVVDAVKAHVAGNVRDDVALLALERMTAVPAGSSSGAGQAV
jgi:sigma-B regulation protein RsbU (phosphoserine phosphatase)